MRSSKNLKKNSFLRKRAILIPLVGLLGVFHSWFFNFGILTHGDWDYYYRQTAATLRSQYFSLWLSDTTFGRVLIDVGQAPTYALYGFFASFLHLDYQFSERIIHLWPTIIVGAIGSYLLANYILKNSIAAAMSSSLFTFNTYSALLDTGHLTLACAGSVAPLCLYFVAKTANQHDLKSTILAVLSLSICTAYEPRVGYMVVLLIVAYIAFLYVVDHKKNYKLDTPKYKQFGRGLKPSLLLIFGAIVFIGVNFYWIYGTYKAGSLGSNDITSRGLFGNSFYDLAHAMTLYNPFWTGSTPLPFFVHPIPVYYWFLPIVCFFGAYLGRKNKLVLFFSLVALGGILLSKQVAEPLVNLYPFLYSSFPGFNAFREASKFYLYIQIGYAILFGAFTKYILAFKLSGHNKMILNTAGFLPIIFPVLVAVPIATGAINTLFENRTIPTSYTMLTRKLQGDTNYFRTFWLPVTTRWSYSDNNHPIIHASSAATSVFKNFISDKDNSVKEDQNTQIFNLNYSKEIADRGSIRYIVVPPRSNNDDEDLYVHHGFNRNAYVDYLKNVKYLTKVNLGKGLDVFENKSYLNYFSTPSNVYKLEKQADIESMHDLIEATGKKDFSFTTSDGSSLTDVTTPFSDVAEMKQLKASISNVNSSVFYVDKNFRDVVVKVDQNVLSLVNKSQGQLSIDGYVEPESDIILGTIANDRGRYLLSIGDDIYYLDGKINTSYDTGKQAKDINIYQYKSENLVSNTSFESSLWQPKIEDCNNYDKNNAQITMSRTEEQHYQGKYSLKLSSNRHTACTHTEIDQLSPSERYELSFDYKTFGGHSYNYKLEFNDSKNTVINKEVVPQSRQWTVLSQLVNVPQGATSVKIYIEVPPDDRNQNLSTAYFDGFSFRSLQNLNSVPYVGKKLEVVKLSDNKKSVALSYDSKVSIGQNRIANASFDTSSWQDKVGDCNAYDDFPKIYQQISHSDSKDGASLLLGAKHHTACVSQAATVSGAGTYNFSFDYKGEGANTLGYSLNFDDPNLTSITDNIDAINGKWFRYSKNIKVPFSAKKVFVTFYGYPPGSGNGYSKSSYDNVRLVKEPTLQGKYLVLNPPNANAQISPKLSYHNVSQTKKTLTATNVKNNFYLSMSESYNTGWKLYLDQNKNESIQDAFKPLSGLNSDRIKHFAVDDLFNGWYINVGELCRSNGSSCKHNNDGTYTLNFVAEFAPERYLNIGLVVSGVTLAGCLGYLGYSFVRSRRKSSGDVYHDPTVPVDRPTMGRLKKEMRMPVNPRLPLIKRRPKR